LKEVSVSYSKRLVLFSALGLMLAVPASSRPAVDLKPGDAAPDFSLQGTDGKTYKLSDLAGKTVVVAWFPKAFTGGCTKECKSLKESGDAIRAYDVKYFAASVDDPGTNKKFAESLELDYPILSDPTKQTAAAYGVLNQHQVADRWTFYIGPDGKIAAIDKDVKARTETAGADIAAKLAELNVAKKKTSN
jgi:thioredoxin-dependent peroxiredoxin